MVGWLLHAGALKVGYQDDEAPSLPGLWSSPHIGGVFSGLQGNWLANSLSRERLFLTVRKVTQFQFSGCVCKAWFCIVAKCSASPDGWRLRASQDRPSPRTCFLKTAFSTADGSLCCR